MRLGKSECRSFRKAGRLGDAAYRAAARHGTRMIARAAWAVRNARTVRGFLAWGGRLLVLRRRFAGLAAIGAILAARGPRIGVRRRLIRRRPRLEILRPRKIDMRVGQRVRRQASARNQSQQPARHSRESPNSTFNY